MVLDETEIIRIRFKIMLSTNQHDYPAYIRLNNRGTLQNNVGLRAVMSSINFKVSCKEDTPPYMKLVQKDKIKTF